MWFLCKHVLENGQSVLQVGCTWGNTGGDNRTQGKRPRRRYTCRGTTAHGGSLVGAQEHSKKRGAAEKGKQCGPTPTSSSSHCSPTGPSIMCHKTKGSRGRRRGVWSSHETGKEVFSLGACLADCLTCFSIPKPVTESVRN